MSAPQIIYWPSTNANLDTIAPSQVVGENNRVQINSNLPNMPNVSVNNSGVYQYQSMIRTISITSVMDEGVTYTITGLGSPPDANNNPMFCLGEISETIVGSISNTSRESLNLYKRIDSITTSAPTAGEIFVGFGEVGITSYNVVNLNSSPLQQWVGQVQPLLAADGFVWTAYASMTFPEVINTQYGTVTPFPAPIPSFTLGNGTNTPDYFNSTNLDLGMARIVWVNFNDTAGDGNASVYYTFIQQGIAG